MTDELKPVPCGCGGRAKRCSYFNHDINAPVYFVTCSACGTQTAEHTTLETAVEAWNKAMGERTAKVIMHKYWLGVSLNVVGEQTIGYEWICENCKKKVLDGDEYCSHCGARLEWE